MAPRPVSQGRTCAGAVPATSSYSAKVALHSGAKDGFVGGPAAVAEDVSAPHALRDFVRSSGDREAVTLFNACVGNVWAFRDIHVTFSALYIGRYTSKETATGGTPYKVRERATRRYRRPASLSPRLCSLHRRHCRPTSASIVTSPSRIRSLTLAVTIWRDSASPRLRSLRQR